jgi:hypothetical protein
MAPDDNYIQFGRTSLNQPCEPWLLPALSECRGFRQLPGYGGPASGPATTAAAAATTAGAGGAAKAPDAGRPCWTFLVLSASCMWPGVHLHYTYVRPANRWLSKAQGCHMGPVIGILGSQ